MLLLIDNYDSFSYNLYQLIGEVNPDIKVVRNDKITLDEIAALSPDYIVLSPGPGRPENAGICVDVVKRFGGEIPLFGVCLGHQAICHAYGGVVTHANKLMHGKQSEIGLVNDCLIFRGLPEIITAGRYHSLAAKPEAIPDCLLVTAQTADGEIMAVKHCEYEVYGVQFHPESILTPCGRQIISNFLEGSQND